MPTKSLAAERDSASVGLNEQLIWDVVPDGFKSLQNTLVNGSTINNTSGSSQDFIALVDLRGCSIAEVHLTGSSIAGAPTASVFGTFHDQATQKGLAWQDSGSGALANGVRRTFTSQPLRGERVARVKITVPNGAAITFTQAEVNAMPTGQADVLAQPLRVSGSATAPAGAALIADTGQLAAGIYRVEVMLGFADTLAAGKALVVEHRNAGNTAQLANGIQAHHSAGSGAGWLVFERVVVAANERIRVSNAAIAGAAGSVASATIMVTPVA